MRVTTVILELYRDEIGLSFKSTISPHNEDSGGYGEIIIGLGHLLSEIQRVHRVLYDIDVEFEDFLPALRQGFAVPTIEAVINEPDHILTKTIPA